jgi:hypothetical protein
MAKETRYNDYLLDEDDEDLVEDGDLSVGDGREDDCYCILKSNTNTWKNDPILGPNLVLMLNGRVSPTDLKQIVTLHLRRDEKEPKKIDVQDGDFQIKL